MRKLMMALLGSVMILSFSGCGNSSSDAVNEDTGNVNSEEKEANIRMIVIENTISDIEQILADYKNEKPNVNVELVPSPDFTAMAQSMLASHQAGDDYDLTMVNHTETRAYVKGEVLLPLDSYIERDGVNYEDIIFESQLESGKVDGVQYAIPTSTDTRVLAVNKDLFAKYGLDYPETMDDMLEVAKVITENGDYGFVNSMARHDYVSTYEQGVFLKSVGGSLYEIKEGKPIATINTPEMKEYLNFNLELLKYMPKDCLTMTEDDGRKSFASGNVGMYIYGPWEFEFLADLDLDFEVDLILIPAGEAGHYSTSGGFQMAIGSGTKEPDAAWDLMKFITTSPENMSLMAKDGLPTFKESFNYGQFTDEKYATFKEQLQTSYLPQEPVANLNEVVADFSSYWEDMLFGKITVDEYCESAQKSVQELLDKNSQ
ncbi:MAG: ABC transporter substrate-binding protein [Lachnospirales bacterium]